MVAAHSALIAIDPGLNGAFAMLLDGEFVAVTSMPVQAKHSGRREVDVGELLACFDGLVKQAGPETRIDILIERVSAMPRQGVSGMFSMGDSFGTARAVATVYAHRLDFVTPSVWKKVLNLTKDKDYSLTIARRLFPAARTELKRKKDEGKAEALLLAKYGFRDHIW